MKKLFALFICILIASAGAIAKCDKTSVKCGSCEVEKVKANSTRTYAEQIKKERATVYNALQLSDEQLTKYTDITLKATKELDEKIDLLNVANLELMVLKSGETNSDGIKAQEKRIKQLKKDIKNVIQNEEKELRKMLNHEQRVKLRMINKLKRKDMKKRAKNYYKHNPKMREFAPHIKAN